MSTETCQNCGSPIGAMEQAFVHAEKVVCGECKRKLDPRYRPPEAPAVQAEPAAVPVAVVDQRRPRKQPLCPQCGVPMRKKTKWTGSFLLELFGAILFLVGLLICFTVIGIIAGLPMMAVGLLCNIRTKQKFWLCRHCRQVIPRG